jgi:hypothetical protein
MAQLAALSPETDGHRRLAACPRCESRRRGLIEVGGRLVGHCLRCGEMLDCPLAVEHLDVASTARARLLLVGSAPVRVR